MGQNPGTLVNIKIGGKWMLISPNNSCEKVLTILTDPSLNRPIIIIIIIIHSKRSSPAHNEDATMPLPCNVPRARHAGHAVAEERGTAAFRFRNPPERLTAPGDLTRDDQE
jgi:hypothetical protein